MANSIPIYRFCPWRNFSQKMSSWCHDHDQLNQLNYFFNTHCNLSPAQLLCRIKRVSWVWNSSSCRLSCRFFSQYFSARHQPIGASASIFVFRPCNVWLLLNIVYDAFISFYSKSILVFLCLSTTFTILFNWVITIPFYQTLSLFRVSIVTKLHHLLPVKLHFSYDSTSTIYQPVQLIP